MKYCICNETYQGWSWTDSCKATRDAGYAGIEIAPFTLAPDVRTLSHGERSEIRAVANGYGLEIVGLHWLLVSPQGLSITTDDCQLRHETSQYLSALVDLCAELGGTNMVLGSPAQRRLPTTVDDIQDARYIAESRLWEVLEPALERAHRLGVSICLEPLPAPEADFILTLAESTEFCKAHEHPALCTMLDVKSACSEVDPVQALYLRHSAIIRHVHVNDANRRGPGFGSTDFVPILAALHERKYSGPVSVEVFDYTPDPVTIAVESIRYLRECESAI